VIEPRAPAMSRAAVVAFVVLVAATFAAFFVAQRLKGAPAVVKLRGVHGPFSPNGDHRHDVERFGVVVRHADELTVTIVDAEGGEVRRLAEGVAARPLVPVPMRWNGRSDEGTLVPDGVYRVRVSLRRTGRTVLAPHGLRVDTRAPRPYVTRVAPGRIVAPGTRVTFTVGHLGRKRPTQVSLWRSDLGRPRVVATGAVAGGAIAGPPGAVVGGAVGAGAGAGAGDKATEKVEDKDEV
jgi:hypothetical protein